MKKILVIDDSPMYRDFMNKQLTSYGFEVTSAINGLDGISKLRTLLPDIIIMDYFLSRKTGVELLQTKMRDPNAKDIPVIMASANVDKDKILEVAQFGVKKFLNKPIKIDSLLSTLSSLLGVTIHVDDTPCLLDAHLNDQILFIEIARGFNSEKINLLQYKIAELLKLYKVRYPRILILMTDIRFRKEDEAKIDRLFSEVEKFVDSFEQVKILTLDHDIKAYLSQHFEYQQIEIATSLDGAVKGLLGIKGLESMTSEQDSVQKVLLSSKSDLRESEAFQLNFNDESAHESVLLQEQSFKIAIIDDDFIVINIVKKTLEKTSWQVYDFDNGPEFINSLQRKAYDLILLDLLMPQMDGFTILSELQARGIKTPTIILSGNTKKESVLKVRQFGVQDFLIKPVQSDKLVEKILSIFKAKV